MERIGLYVKTNSVMKSSGYDKMRVNFNTANGEFVGGIIILFDREKGAPSKEDGTLQLSPCAMWWPFDGELPSSVDKVWKFTLHRDSEIRVKIECNGKLVQDTVISDDTCFKDWSSWKSRDAVKQIKFYGEALDGYRPSKYSFIYCNYMAYQRKTYWKFAC